MARCSTFVAAPPSRVWQTLSDPAHYGYWLVGSRSIRGADDAFPAPGTRFHHTVGVGPFHIGDHTEVRSAHPPWRLELRARARPLGAAHVRLQLRREGTGTRVVMVEDPAFPLGNLLIGWPGHLALRLRNRVALRRLKRLVEGPSHG